MVRRVHQLMESLREKPMRFAYVLCALVLGVIVFTLADILPAPYDFRH